MIVATAGHVDHGKTTLVRAITGVDTDRLPQEKARGMSIDLGFAYLRGQGRAPIAFVDVPGHERFVRNMIAGVHTVDLALLVVAADDGPMPQTAEHVAILQALGAPRAAVVLTKIDRVDDARRAAACREIDALLADTRFAGAPVFAVAAPSGEGVGALIGFLEEVAAEPHARDDRATFRMHVDRAFVLQGIGLVVTGTIVGGQIDVGGEVWVSRTQRVARVRSLRANDTEATTARAGERCALALAGFSRDDVERGDVLLGTGGIAPSRRLDVMLTPIVHAPTPGDPMSHEAIPRGLISRDPENFAPSAARPAVRIGRSGRSVLVCIGTQAVRATLSPIGEDPSLAGFARLALDAPVTTFLGDALLLRDAGSNMLIAGGAVLDSLPPERGAGRKRQPQRLRVLADAAASAAPRLLALLLEPARQCVDLEWFRTVTNATAAVLGQAVSEAVCEVFEEDGASVAIGAANMIAAAQALAATVDAWHAEYPQHLGVRFAQALEGLRDWPPVLMRAALKSQLACGALVRTGPFLRRPAHRPTLTGPDATLWQSIAPVLDGGEDPKPPRVHELAERFALLPADIEAFLVRAVHAGLVYRVARNRFFLPHTVVALGELACALAAESGRDAFDAAAFRNRSGLGRNLTIEVLEFLDSVGITRRAGDERRVVGVPRELMLQ